MPATSLVEHVVPLPVLRTSKLQTVVMERSSAGYGNRTRIYCLGSNRSTTKLIPRLLKFIKIISTRRATLPKPEE